MTGAAWRGAAVPEAGRRSRAARPAAPLSRAEFARITGVSRETLGRFDAYVALLGKWGRRINLVSRASMADVWRRHLLDSAQLLGHVPADCRRLVDLGSGAGFPGLVLAVLGIEGVELIESDGRKCAFLAEAARVAGATVTVNHARIESLPSSPAGVVTARACAPLARLLALAERFLDPQSRLIALKGAHIDDELTNATKSWTMDADQYPSLTDPDGWILCMRNVRRETDG